MRLLIADDVGIGKTIEAGLIAEELLAQGSAQRLAVLCPPASPSSGRTSCGQVRPRAGAGPARHRTGWNATLGVRPVDLRAAPVTIVSTDFIKSDMRRDDFLRACPELVIVDEAHASVSDDTGSHGAAHQRYRLVKDLASDARHLILVTATPHSGNEDRVPQPDRPA